MAAAVFLAAQWALNMELRNLDASWVEPPPGAGERWNSDLFRALTFGNAPASVDWLWLKSLQDMSIAKAAPGTHPSIYFDLDLATDLDPAYFEAYVNGANLLTVIRGDAEGARSLLLKAEKFRKDELTKYPESFRKEFWPGAWYPSFILAYIYLFEMNDLPDASLSFQEAARLQGAPPYLKKLTERLTKHGGQYEVGLRLLSFMIESARDVKVRDELVQKRDSLMVAQYLFNANDAFRFYLNSLGRYRQQQEVSVSKLKEYWSAFQRDQGFPGRDPWGGQLALSNDGRIVTTTPHQRVLGLD